LSPVQAAVVSEAVRIVRSPEGDVLRQRLFTAVQALREGFASHGIECHGSPSAIVPVPFRNDRLARLASRRIAESGVFVNLVEYPAVPIGEARLRMQVMATHSPEQAGEAVKRVMEGRHAAENDLLEWQRPVPSTAAET
jgi:glycine C-acetyltransferase